MHQSKKVLTVLQILLALVIFIAPTNLFLSITEQYAYVTGLRVDYLIPKLYLTEVLMSVVIAVYLYLNRKSIFSFEITNIHKVLLLALLYLVIQQFLSPLPFIGIWTLISWCLILLTMKVAIQIHFFKSRYFILAVGSTLVFQSGVGILQYILQKSLLGYYFLGETNLLNFAGISKDTFLGVEKILPYGTTAHPNVLAGFLVCYSLLLLFSKKTISQKIETLALLLSSICLFLTLSFSAWLSAIIGILLFLFSRHIHTFSRLFTNVAFLTFCLIPIVLTIFANATDNTSIQRRAVLNAAAIELIITKPLGMGLGQFVYGIEEYMQTDEIVRFLQPVHHVPLLFLSEIGILPILLIILSCYFYRHSLFSKESVKLMTSRKILVPICILVPILNLDHYLWSLEPGRVLLVIFVGYFLVNSNNKKRPS